MLAYVVRLAMLGNVGGPAREAGGVRLTRCFSAGGLTTVVAASLIGIFAGGQDWSHAQSASGWQAQKAAAAAAPAPAAPAYVLGVHDQIRVHAVEWRPSRDELFEWKSINNEYVVGSNGAISVPLVGEVVAAGLSPTALAKDISSRLRNRLGTATAPDVSVSIVQYRPFYITGDVSRPGEYPFRPGLTVLQAVAVAGGLPRTLLTGREMLEARQKIAASSVVVAALLARRARLTAELRGDTTLTFPDELVQQQGDPSVAALLRQETTIFMANREAEASDRGNLEKLSSFLTEQLQILTSMNTINRDRYLSIEQERVAMQTLKEKGLANRRREFDVERLRADQDDRELRVKAELLRANQELSRTSIMITELTTKRRVQVATELRETQRQIDEHNESLAAAYQLLRLGTTGAIDANGSPLGTPRKPSYRIVREVGSVQKEFDAAETDRLNPGDSLKVFDWGTSQGRVETSSAPFLSRQ